MRLHARPDFFAKRLNLPARRLSVIDQEIAVHGAVVGTRCL